MKKKIIFTSTLLGIITLVIFMSSFTSQENKQKDYMTIVTDNIHREIIISKSGQDAQIIELDKNISIFDFQTTLQLIKKYEYEGWKVEANNYTAANGISNATNYFYLTKGI